MATPNHNNLIRQHRPVSLAGSVFIIGLAVVPVLAIITIIVGRGPMHTFCESHPIVRWFTTTCVALSFFGCTYSPFLSSKPLDRKATLSIAAFFAYVIISFMFGMIAWPMED